MRAPITSLIEENIMTLKDFAELNPKDIKTIIGARSYSENYDVFKFLQYPLTKIFDLIFPFIEADTNWKIFSDYCEFGYKSVADTRNISWQRVYQEVDKIREIITPLVSEVAKQEIKKSKSNSITISNLCSKLHNRISPIEICELLSKKPAFKINSNCLYFVDR